MVLQWWQEKPAMKSYEITTLDSSDKPVERFEVQAADITGAYETALVALGDDIPPAMWIGPTKEDWYVTLRKTPAVIH